MSDYELSKTYRTTFNANNVATVEGVGPQMAGESWRVTSTSVWSNSEDPSELRIFTNSTFTQQREGTVKGNLDTSDTVFDLRSGAKLYYQWTGGTPGAEATVTVTGTYTIPGNRGGGI